MIVKLTPTPRDDTVLEKVVTALKHLGLHVRDKVPLLALCLLLPACATNSDGAKTFGGITGAGWLNIGKSAIVAAAPVAVSERLRQIGHQLRTQDNRCTANPIFQVRGKERIYGLDPSASDEAVWMDDDWNSVDIPEDADPDQPPHGLTVAPYTTRWKVLMVAFTEQGCKDHLRLNGHNYQIYDEVGIYVDSLNRCAEMIAIREFF
jgi:hypothetical protein